MKKLCLSLLVVFACRCVSYAQWLTGTPSSSIYYGLGNVGIGTSSPGAKLYIAGGGRNGLMIDGSLDGTPTTSYLSLWQGSGAVGIDAIGSGQIYMGYDQASNIFFGGHLPNGVWQASGNVGIGTTSPSSLLTVGSTAIRGTINVIAGSDAPAIALTDQRSGGHAYSIYSGVSGVGNLDIYDQTAGSYSLTINSSGSIGIGTQSPDAKLAVAGTIHTQEVKVDMTGWSDYVFKPTYKLPKLTEVKAYIDKNHHLPGSPSQSEVVQNGIMLTEILKLQQKKIEELTLYLIRQKEQNEEQQKQITQQLKVSRSLQRQIDQLNAKNRVK